ncbi:MAG: hypothetical protein JXA71_02560 [Chitinispirillaceae bacterium]|nr:hypothetical protein [Chitinispirillaceae bacterium]
MAPNRSTSPHPNLLYLLFFLTGTCGLIYQVVWARMFGLVFGNTVFAASTVLAAFMAGLAIGSYVAGRYPTHAEKGLRRYAFIEVCIGICGAAMPLAVHLVDGWYGAIFRLFDPTFGVLTLIRFFLSFLIILIPCTFMGASLPIMIGYVSPWYRLPERATSLFYGINTLGAFTGCFFTGFFFIGTLGMIRTSFLAGAINVAAAAAAWALSRKYPAPPAPESMTQQKTASAANDPSDRWAVALLLSACAITGFAALGMEVAWMRALVWIVGTDSYAFAHMLAVVLFGIGAGSLIASFLVKTAPDKTDPLFWTVLLLGAMVALSTNALCLSYEVNRSVQGIVSGALGGIVNTLPAAWRPDTVTAFQYLFELHRFIVPSFVMAIPATLMGIAFPLFVKKLDRPGFASSRNVGTAYAANTLGAILGSLCMGFVLIPQIGLFPSILLMAALYGAAAALVLAASARWKAPSLFMRAAALGAALLLLPFIVKTDFRDLLDKTMRSDPLRLDERLLYFKEHATGGVLVKESAYYGREMCIDGVQVASTGAFDLHSHLYPAHLMCMLRPNAQNALLIAFGCGGTAGSMLLYDTIKQLDVVEICDGVVEPAKRFFPAMNRNVLDNPRLNLIIQDGRNYVRMTDKRYDIIYSGPIHPQTSQGSAALYTRDFFNDCGKRLAPGGIQCVWLPLHMRSVKDFKTVVKSFLDAYPHACLWQLPQTSTSVCHPHLIGSKEEITIDYQAVGAALNRPDVSADLKRIGDCGFEEPYEFISQLAMSESTLRRMVEGIDVATTDDRPIVEFYDIANSSQETAKTGMLLELGNHMENPLPWVRNIPAEKQEGLIRDIERMLEGTQYLLLGHFFYIRAQESGIRGSEDLANLAAAYEKSLEFIPGSAFPATVLGQMHNGSLFRR